MNLKKRLIKLSIIFIIFSSILMNATAAVYLDGSVGEDIYLRSGHDGVNKLNIQDSEYSTDHNNTDIVSIGEDYLNQKFSVNTGSLFDDNELLRRHERGVLEIANYISIGLIPKVKLIEDGKEVIFDNNYGCIYSNLTLTQKVDLFINMLCDLVLLNPDSHSGHFGITMDGCLLSFNKNKSYFFIKNVAEVDMPNMLDNFFSESRVYKNFIQELKKHPKELNELLNDVRVEEAFLRINSLANLQTEREYIKQVLAPLFEYIKQEAGDTRIEEQIINDYFRMLGDIPLFLAKKFGVKKSLVRESVLVDNEWVRKTVTFDPKVNEIKLISAEEVGLSEGGRVDEIAKKANVVAAMNGGFFTEGGKSSALKGKIYSLIYSATGITVGKNYAFPSAILKIKNKLLSDTDNYLPALGIGDSGDIKMGEVKVVWSAKLYENDKKIILDRISDIDSDSKNATIYYYENELRLKEIGISDNKVSYVRNVFEVVAGVSNCYWLHDPSEEIIAEFDNLKKGDYLSYGYELEAVDYSGNVDVELTSYFNNCPYVVSGGQLIMTDGRLDPRISKNYNREKYTHFKTIICSSEAGKISLMVQKWWGMHRDKVIEFLKKEGCEHAISLDGGESTTLVTRHDDKVYGFNRVVSDIIAVMPRYSDTLLSDFNQ